MKKTILSVLMALLLSVGLLAAAIDVPATAEWVMLPLMEHFAPPEATGLPAEEYAPVVRMITSFLRGREEAFQHVCTMDGVGRLCFQAHEQQHMEDVQGLFTLARRVGWLCLGAVCALGLLCGGRPGWRAVRWTLLALLAGVTVVILLAAIDFNSLFILFHQVAFTNDLWLLDPRTDLLIRLMPIEFFVSYAAIIGGLWLLGMVALLVLSTIRIKKMQDKGE